MPMLRALQLVAEDGARLAELRPQPRFSPRELDCVRLLVRGFTDEQMAARLAISHATVRFHLDGARRKAAARSRTHLAALAVAQGVAQP
ncbi:MAG TPA: helix-turn-helix transcriptional regulator [Caulobacteraceae bacterium]|jgi:DNA-binding CsgD family transcriptional regulator